MTSGRAGARRRSARRPARRRTTAAAASGASTTGWYAAADRRSRRGGLEAIGLWVFALLCWTGAAVLDPAWDDRHDFHPRWPVAGQIDALGRSIGASTAESISPVARVGANILILLPFVATLGVYLHDRWTRARDSGTAADRGGDGSEGGVHVPGLGPDDAHYVAVYHRRQVAASMLAIGVVGTGLVLRMVTGTTDHGPFVFAGVILALFTSYQLTARCPRCGVSLARAARKRAAGGWLLGVDEDGWRQVKCPACRVQLRTTR